MVSTFGLILSLSWQAQLSTIFTSLRSNCDQMQIIISNLYCIDGKHVLVVLLQQVHRVLRHSVLRAPQKERACVYAARHPPRDHAHVGVVRAQVRSRSVPNTFSSAHKLYSKFAELAYTLF